MQSKNLFIRNLLLAVFSLLIMSATAQDGAQLYGQNCAQCHGANLTGGNAASLVDGIWQFGAEDGYVFRNIKFGVMIMISEKRVGIIIWNWDT